MKFHHFSLPLGKAFMGTSEKSTIGPLEKILPTLMEYNVTVIEFGDLVSVSRSIFACLCLGREGFVSVTTAAGLTIAKHPTF